MKMSQGNFGDLWYQPLQVKSEQDEYQQSFQIGTYGKNAPSLRQRPSSTSLNTNKKIMNSTKSSEMLIIKRRKIRPISSLCAKKANLPACFLADPLKYKNTRVNSAHNLGCEQPLITPPPQVKFDNFQEQGIPEQAQVL
jgi:hypothetical protein